MAMQNLEKYIFYIIFLFLLNISFASENQKQISNAVLPSSILFPSVANKISKELKQYLDQHKRAEITTNLYVSKTNLLKLYALQYKDNYDLIWFFNSTKDLGLEMSKLANQINLAEGSNAVSTANTIDEVISYLNGKSRWLLVFDNVCMQNSDLLKKIISLQSNGHVIWGCKDGISSYFLIFCGIAFFILFALFIVFADYIGLALIFSLPNVWVALFKNSKFKYFWIILGCAILVLIFIVLANVSSSG